MSGIQWKDVTSYSRMDADRTPRVWAAKAGLLKITVHRHIHHPGLWLLTCEPFCNCRELTSAAVDDAKSEALDKVHAWLREASKAITSARPASQ